MASKRLIYINVLSLFNGISCGRVALERAGIPVNRYVSYEIDKYANKIAHKNYPNDEYNGDVTTADFTQYKGFDLLIGGSPCTYWSIAKKEREVTPDGIGGQLFLHFVRALKESGCKYFLYENNYSIHKDIKAFISNQLGVMPIMINSALVSAQQRKRCYWTNIPNVQQPDDKGILLKDIIESGLCDRDKSRCLLSSCGRTTTREYFKKSQGQMIAEPICVNSQSGNRSNPNIKQPSLGNRIYSLDGKNPALTCSFITNIAEPIGIAQRGRYINSDNRSKKVDGGTYQTIEARKDGKANCITTVQKDSMVAEPIICQHPHGFNKGGIKKDKSPTLTATSSWIHNNYIVKPVRIGYYGKGGQGQRIYSVCGKSVCLQSQSGGMGTKTGLYKIDLPDGDYIIRKLTPIEAERLQTLPDNYTEGISNTQRYKCIGNGWTVDVIAHILKNLKEVSE